MSTEKQLSPEQQFAVGEVALVCNTYFKPENEGRECTIVGELKVRRGTQTGEPYLCYLVEMQHGERLGCRPDQLRKKRPPEWPSQEQLKQQVAWKDCVWQPAGVKP